MKCPNCKFFGDGNIYSIYGQKICVCDMCNGTTKIYLKTLWWRFLGQIIKRRRIKKEIPLRQASLAYRIPVEVLSKMERGCIKPKMLDYKIFP